MLKCIRLTAEFVEDTNMREVELGHSVVYFRQRPLVQVNPKITQVYWIKGKLYPFSDCCDVLEVRTRPELLVSFF